MTASRPARAPLSLHDALPICSLARCVTNRSVSPSRSTSPQATPMFPWARSEEHTSELQSHHDLVCRLLLEKKNIRRTTSPNSCITAPPPLPHEAESTPPGTRD